jgi:hypothetical protein
MMLAVAESILENPDDPIPAIGERFIAWAHSGYRRNVLPKHL